MSDSQTTIPWKSISQYHGGEALFYYPEVKGSQHASNDRSATCDFGLPWKNRKPTYFTYVFPPEEA